MAPKRLLSVCSIVLMLGGCATEGGNNKARLETIPGAAGAAAPASKAGRGGGGTAATAAGTLIGAWVGGEIGRSLDKADQIYVQRATRESLENGPPGTASRWSNPDSGNSGSVTPQPAFQDSNGRYCREFQQTVTVGGSTETAYGTACRQPDGTWKIVPS